MMGQDLNKYKHLMGRPSQYDLNMAVWAVGKFYPWFRSCFINLDLSQRDFHNKRFNRLPLHGCDCQYADFSHADLSYCYICDCDFRDADFAGANLYGAEIIGCDFGGADLNSVKLANNILLRNRGIRNDR